jgi:hypothetical protein
MLLAISIRLAVESPVRGTAKRLQKILGLDISLVNRENRVRRDLSRSSSMKWNSTTDRTCL